MSCLSACFQSMRFWQYFSFFVFSDLFCVLFMGQYKSLGLAHGYSDQLLSTAACLSAISQTAGRFFASTFYDWYGVKPIFLTMMVLNFLMAVSVYDMLKYPVIYFLLVQLNFFLIGGIFSLFPTPILKSFGPKYGPQVYTLTMLGGIVASLLVTLLVQFCSKPLGLRGLFNVGAAFALFTIYLITQFDERVDIERLDAKGLIVWGAAIKTQAKSRPQSDDDFERVDVLIVRDEVENSSTCELTSELSHGAHSSGRSLKVDRRRKMSRKRQILDSMDQSQAIINKIEKSDDTFSECTETTRGSDAGSGERLIERNREKRSHFARSAFRKTEAGQYESSDWSSDASDGEDDSQK